MAERASRARAIRHVRRAGTLALLALCAACTGVTDPAGFGIVTQDKYDFMTCPEIVGNRAGLIAREKDLADLTAKADSSPGGLLVSITAYRSELAATRAQLRVAEKAARQNNCDTPKR